MILTKELFAWLFDFIEFILRYFFFYKCHLVPRNSTDKIVSINVFVRATIAIISGTLPSTFMGSTTLTVNYTLMSGGVVFSETSPSGGAGQTLTVTLTNLQIGVPYTFSVFVTHGRLLVEVTGTFSSGMATYNTIINPFVNRRVG